MGAREWERYWRSSGPGRAVEPEAEVQEGRNCCDVGDEEREGEKLHRSRRKLREPHQHRPHRLDCGRGGDQDGQRGQGDEGEDVPRESEDGWPEGTEEKGEEGNRDDECHARCEELEGDVTPVVAHEKRVHGIHFGTREMSPTLLYLFEHHESVCGTLLEQFADAAFEAGEEVGVGEEVGGGEGVGEFAGGPDIDRFCARFDDPDGSGSGGEVIGEFFFDLVDGVGGG